MAITSEFKGLTLEELTAPDVLYRDTQEKKVAEGMEHLNELADYRALLDPEVDKEELEQLDHYSSILSNSVNRIARGLTQEDVSTLNQGRLFYGTDILPLAKIASLRAARAAEQQKAYLASNGRMRFDKDLGKTSLREFNPNATFKSVNLDDVYKRAETVYKSVGEAIKNRGLEDIVLNNNITLQQAYTAGIPMPEIQRMLAGVADERADEASFILSEATKDIKDSYNYDAFDGGVQSEIDATIESAVYNSASKKYEGNPIDPYQLQLDRELKRAQIEGQEALAEQRRRQRSNMAAADWDADVGRSNLRIKVMNNGGHFGINNEGYPELYWTPPTGANDILRWRLAQQSNGKTYLEYASGLSGFQKFTEARASKKDIPTGNFEIFQINANTRFFGLMSAETTTREITVPRMTITQARSAWNQSAENLKPEDYELNDRLPKLENRSGMICVKRGSEYLKALHSSGVYSNVNFEECPLANYDCIVYVNNNGLPTFVIPKIYNNLPVVESYPHSDNSKAILLPQISANTVLDYWMKDSENNNSTTPQQTPQSQDNDSGDREDIPYTDDDDTNSTEW